MSKHGPRYEYEKRWRKDNPDRVFLYFIKFNYGITKDEYLGLLRKQKGRCAICRKKDTFRLGVDHNHRTNKVRGLLCRACNRGLGMFGDSLRLLRIALAYMEEA